MMWTTYEMSFENSSIDPYGGRPDVLRTESNMTQANKAPDIETDFLQLARIALSGRTQDVQVILRRAAKRYHATVPTHRAE
jgi:hypothetical protein